MKSVTPTTTASTREEDPVHLGSQGILSQVPISTSLASSVKNSKSSHKNCLKANTEDENINKSSETSISGASGSTFWPELKDTTVSHNDMAAMNPYVASRRFSGPFFGRSLVFWQHRSGYPFPPCICNMLAYLQHIENSVHGIFRRAGGKLRVQALRERLEKDICKFCFLIILKFWP